MLKILQASLQQYVNHELPDVQAGFRKGRGTTDQIANIYLLDHQKSKRVQPATISQNPSSSASGKVDDHLLPS